MYARISTTDEKRQLRSIDDQEKECFRAIDNRNDIDRSQIVEIFEENGSAKSPNKHPIFNKMIEGFQTGKYHYIDQVKGERRVQSLKDIIAQDEVCKKVVPNLFVKNNFVSVINLNPPYDSMVDLTKISSGWG